MAYTFGDGFDLYTTIADAFVGFWDSGSSNASLVAGRFSNSRAIFMGTTNTFVKNSGANDAVHHVVVAYLQTATISGTTLGVYLQLSDGATAQCSIVFRSDGAIVLTSGGPTGTTLATYTGAVLAANTWYAFEFEISINNTTGVFNVRKNGNVSNDFSATSLDTQNSANAYANRLTLGLNASVNHNVDDVFWQSGASTGTWLGDIRCYTRMPTTDASVQFTQSPNPVTQTLATLSTTVGAVTNAAYYTAFVASFTGAIGSATISLFSATAATLKASIYDNSNAGAPGTPLGSATPLVAPGTGIATFTFPSPVSVTRGNTYYIAVCLGGNTSFNCSPTQAANFNGATTYASFPSTNPPSLTSGSPGLFAAVVVTLSSPPNAAFVGEFQEDAGNSYVTDNTTGHNDLYNISTIASVPNSTVAVTTRAFVQKTDAGSRSVSVQLKSGSTVVQSPNPSLSTNTWTWLYRTDTVDPNTTLAWSAANVALAQIGPIIVT